MVDDLAFGILAGTCPHLRQLNASRTWITDAGVRALCFARDGITLLTTKVSTDLRCFLIKCTQLR